MDTKDLYKLVRELSEENQNVVNLHDSVDIELNEGFVIETGVVGFTGDGVILHLDEDAMEFLDFNGVLLESENIDEGSSVDAVYSAVLHRIKRNHLDVISKYGPKAVMAAIEQVAEFAGSRGLEEIGSSDVSIWTNQVIKELEAGTYEHLHEHPVLMALGRAAASGAGAELAGRVADKIGLEEDDDDDPNVVQFKDKISTSDDPFMLVYDAINGKHGETIRAAMQDMYDEVGFELHPDDDFEKIIYTILDYIADDSAVKKGEQLDELADIMRLAKGKTNQEDLEEGLGKYAMIAAALMSLGIAGNKIQADHLMKTQPQLIALVQMRQEAENQGDKYRVKELDNRIKKTMDHILVTGGPVMGHDGKPVDPRKPVGEAEYQGRKVTLNKPMQGDVAKSKVYVKKPNGKVVKVNFGDKNMRIKKSNPARRKSFRARHKCDNPGPRWKARYWSCRMW